MTIYKKISKNIKYYRELKNITQQELAKKSDLSFEYIRRIESPKYERGFTIQTVYQIAQALEIDITLLFDEPKN